MIENDTTLQQYEQAYLAALSLYDILRTSGMIQVRRAELRQGEVKAEPIDFCADIEVRAARTLTSKEELLQWWNVLEETWHYPDLPKGIQQALGKAFFENDLGVEGHYRMLYFRVKNQIERKHIKETTDARAAEQLLIGDEGNFESTGCDISYRLYQGPYACGSEMGGPDGQAEAGDETAPCDPA